MSLSQFKEIMVTHGLFTTPESAEVLYDWVERHAPEYRVHIYTAIGMYHNLIVKYFNELVGDINDVDVQTPNPKGGR